MGSNADIVRRFREAFEAGDIGAALTYLSPDAEILPIRARLEGTTYRGHDGYRQMVADFAQDWDDLRLDVEEERERGDCVLSSGRMSARGNTSGVELDVPMAFVFDVRDGLIARMESFTDLGEALRAAGIED